jgi:hypothetical protein
MEDRLFLICKLQQLRMLLIQQQHKDMMEDKLSL